MKVHNGKCYQPLLSEHAGDSQDTACSCALRHQRTLAFVVWQPKTTNYPAFGGAYAAPLPRAPLLETLESCQSAQETPARPQH